MTEQDAIDFVRGCDEDDGPESDEHTRALFRALYEREPDAEDEQAGIWNLCCAAVG